MLRHPLRVVSVRAHGGPEQLVPETGEAPVPGPGQILVEVEAAGVKFLDVMQRKEHGRTPPFVPGLEGVGRVAAVGEGTAGAPAIGTRVAWIVAPGSYAERVIVPAERAIPVPGDLAPGEAMLFQALTAQYLAAEYRDVRPGDRVLVQAAAGGVGQILVQMLKRRGAWVIGTVSTEEKAGGASDAGADAVINYGRDGDFLPALRKLTDGRGVDLAFDSVGTTTLANTIKGLARGGTAVSYGSASGPPPAVSPMELTSPCARVAGGSVFSYVADAAELRRRAVKVLDGIRAGWLRPFPHLHRRGDRAGNGRDAAGAIAPAPAGFLSAFDRPMRHFGRYPVIPITLPRRDADRWKSQDAFFAWTGSPRPSRRESDNRRDRLRVRTNEERGLGATCVGDTSRANVLVLPGRRLLSHDRSVMGLRRNGHELPRRSPSGLGGNDPAAALGSGPRRRRS